MHITKAAPLQAASKAEFVLCHSARAGLIVQLQDAAIQAHRKAEQAEQAGQKELAQVFRTMAQTRERAAEKMMNTTAPLPNRPLPTLPHTIIESRPLHRMQDTALTPTTAVDRRSEGNRRSTAGKVIGQQWFERLPVKRIGAFVGTVTTALQGSRVRVGKIG